MTVGISDNDLNLDPAKADTVTIEISNDAGVTKRVVLTEIDLNTVRFSATVLTGDEGISVSDRTVITVTYVDKRYRAEGSS